MESSHEVGENKKPSIKVMLGFLVDESMGIYPPNSPILYLARSAYLAPLTIL